ncbi:MAG: carotenoid oxygenase family protein [Cyanobacteria bacterium P01_H01_bin.119]
MQTIEPSTQAQSATFDMEDWRGGYRSQPEEFAYWIEEIEGEIPQELTGTLFRVGPGLLDINGYPIKHPFDGDGMVNAIAIKNGRAFYSNRFVKTAGYVAEKEAGKPLYRGVFGTQKPGGWLANAFDLRLKNIANTNILYWGDRLLALWEAAEPHRLDPTTLDTLGLDNLWGAIAPGDSFTAHPHIDPAGADGQPRLVGFSVKPGLSSTITVMEFTSDGILAKKRSHTTPGFSFLHDFAITPSYAIFFQNPVSFNPMPFILGMKGAGECVDFQADQSTKIVIIPRDGASPVQTLETDPCFVFHFANAFEQDGKLWVDAVCYDRLFSEEDVADYLNVNFDTVPQGQLKRFYIDLAAQQVDWETVISRCCEFPSLHPDKVGRNNRYLYIGAAHKSSGNAPLQAVLKRDFQTGEEQLWSIAPRSFTGEPVFVPRPGSTAEDDGWVLMLLYNAERCCSDLAILDGKDITRELARLHLSHHVPYGLHGSFTDNYFGPEG